MLSLAVSDEEPWGVWKQRDQEQQYLYLECAEEDKRRDQHKAVYQEVNSGRSAAAPQVVVNLLSGGFQTESVMVLKPANQNLFLHKNQWNDKHVVIVWQCGMVRQGQMKQRAKMGWYFW